MVEGGFDSYASLFDNDEKLMRIVQEKQVRNL